MINFLKYLFITITIDLFQAQAQASNLEKKQKKVDQQINEWKLKCDEIQADLDKAQRDARGYSTEVRSLACYEHKLVCFIGENCRLS